MKTMTCRQLGGACDKEFSADTFEEIAEMSKEHGMEMYRKRDQSHLAAMSKMRLLIEDPEKMKIWVDDKRAEFLNLPED